jgi:hypothetical protein
MNLAARPWRGAPQRACQLFFFIFYFFWGDLARDLLHRKPRAGQLWSGLAKTPAIRLKMTLHHSFVNSD